jgi:hypothetical protein
MKLQHASKLTSIKGEHVIMGLQKCPATVLRIRKDMEPPALMAV